MSAGVLEVEILRGKHFPQSEDDPNPCSTQVKVTLIDENGTLVGEEQCSSIQENSNAPFFKDVVRFEVYGGMAEGTLVVRVAELSRKPTPFIILAGVKGLMLEQFKSKRELSVPLSLGDVPAEMGAAASDTPPPPADRPEGPFLSLRIQYQSQRPKEPTTDPHADVVLPPSVHLDGTWQLVPANSQYVWLRLMTDTRWTESFRGALVNAWRARPRIEPQVTFGASSTKDPAGRRKTGKPGEKEGETDIRTVGDVIVKRWCCRRVHQVLSRLRLTAEKFGSGDLTLTLAPQEEMEFRAEKKARSFLLEDMCRENLTKTGSRAVRDWLERLWVVYAVGVDNDPSGPKSLSADVRRRVGETVFDEEDAVLLTTCLLGALVPSLSPEACQSIVEEDFSKRASWPTPDEVQRLGPNVTAGEWLFVKTLVAFLGALMDTLTDAEMALIAKTFKPAVISAHERVKRGGKAGIQARVRPAAGDLRHYKGDGIPIDHLDKYGRRKKEAKFV